MWSGWVLLWKHTMMRKRTFITLCEYLFPLIFIGLAHILALSIYYYDDAKKFKESVSFEEREYEGSILYTPGTRFTDLLMSKVGDKLNLKRLDHLPMKDEIGYFSFTNETSLSMLKYSRDIMSSEDAIVIFENTGSNTWLMRLNYTIRMKTDFMSNELNSFAADKEEGLNLFNLRSHKNFGLQYKAFMHLQWAIDTSYLRLITGANIGQTLALQAIPFNNADKERILYITKSTCILLPLALMIPIAYLGTRLFKEKNSGLHELQKVAGVRGETIAFSHVLDTFPIVLLYVIIGAVYFMTTGMATNAGYIVLAMTLHSFTVVAMTFFILYLFDISSDDCVQLVIIGIMEGFWLLGLLVAKNVKNRALALSLSLIPHEPYLNFWRSLGHQELLGDGIQMSNMWTLQDELPTTVFENYVFMVLQILLFSILSWYLSKVRPGKHGQALSWNLSFKSVQTANAQDDASLSKLVPYSPAWTLCSREPSRNISNYLWNQSQVYPGQKVKSQFVKEDDEQYFEKAPYGLPVGIKVANVYKWFNNDQVLNGVTLAIYRGEITVLLGHNGAGKTTLINIITGLIPATSGRVLVEGKDTRTQSVEARKHIGLCPQHNIFFDNLSVVEHVMFFAMLKGQSYSQSKETASQLLEKLQLTDKAGELPTVLSGGMKRRAQLACAVAGGAKVLMLDEPTSGLDVETRRELWDLLLSLRGEHTVLLTTHFMEEADALGDRIAALHNGRVRCNATAMFLKRAIGTGYRLTFTTIGAPNEAAISSIISVIVPNATVHDRRPNSVTYSLPAKDMARFPQLFTAIENARSKLQFDTICIGTSTLDEVFLKLCSDGKPTHEYVDDSTKKIKTVLKKVSGCKLCARQFAVLLLRQWRYLNLLVYIISIIGMAIMFYLITIATNNSAEKKKLYPKVALNLDLYAARPKWRAFGNVDGDGDTRLTLRAGFSGVLMDDHVAKAVLRAGTENMFNNNNKLNKFILAIQSNDTSAKALYSPLLRHAAPIALNSLSNAWAERLQDGRSKPLKDDGMKSLRRKVARTITVYNHPLWGAYVPYDETTLKLPKSVDMINKWITYIVTVVCFYLTSLARLPCEERLAGTRHAYIMAGAPRALHWTVTLVTHVAQMIPVCVSIVVCLAADEDYTFDQTRFKMSVFALLALSLPATLGLVYLFSTLLSLMASTTLLVVIIMVGTCSATLVPESKTAFYKLTYIPYVLLPPNTLAFALMKAGKVAQVNGHCNLNRDKCPELAGPGVFEAKICCESLPGSEPWSYLAPGDGAGWEMITLVVQAIVYFVLTYVSDDGTLGGMLGRLLGRGAKPPELRFEDPAVQAEATYVEKNIKLPNQLIPDAVLGYNVQKVYTGCMKQPFFAVKGISFSVKKGECFGLLGVNGAGKSTTFKMLTGRISPTGGEIFANGYPATKRRAYMSTFSYCPQSGGVDDFLTGRQNLTLLLTLRGLNKSDVTAVASSWIEEVELSKYADRRVSSYSGGTARRLTAVAALCQAARTAVLDEPTAGVDLVARRYMLKALLRARSCHSIIIASHSMDEIEALCDYIAIMSGGELRALGSAPELKTRHAQGYSVVFKLATADVGILNEFKEQLQRSFDCELKDQHRNTLRYHVKGTLLYSDLFAHLEDLREQFPVVENYTVTETTLEEVFLALAREAKEALE